MILTVTLNAALDKTYRVSGFEPGGIFHTEEQHTSAGGKGINVARIAKTLGATVVTTGFLGGRIGAYVEHLLAQDGLNPHFVPIANETRICTAIVDPIRGVETKVNERGPMVSEMEASLFLKTLTELAIRARFVAFCGTIPLDMKPDFYADCIRIVKRSGVWCALDTYGPFLNAALHSLKDDLPDLLKPNAQELSETTGQPIQTFEDALQQTEEWIQKGADGLITFGAKGVLLHSKQGILIGAPPVVQYKSAVGSGDSALGAYLWALSRNEPLSEALKWAVAAGAANAATFGAATCTAEQIRDQYEKTTVAAYRSGGN